MSTQCEKPAPANDFLFRDILCDTAMMTNRSLSETTGNEDRGRVPQWRLAREGPFTNERSQASLQVLGKGCASRHTTYSVEDHAPPEGGLGVPLNHPRFLEWLGAPESAWLLEMSPGQWCDTLSRDQTMTAAMRLHRDVCLMKTNLDILETSTRWHYTERPPRYCKRQLAAAHTQEQRYQQQRRAREHAKLRSTWRH